MDGAGYAKSITDFIKTLVILVAVIALAIGLGIGWLVGAY
jgi:hypothetical protein